MSEKLFGSICRTVQLNRRFQQAECSGDIQSADRIGFWCDYEHGDGSVMMIGGEGNSCSRADHGIGITEANDACFAPNMQYYQYDQHDWL